MLSSEPLDPAQLEAFKDPQMQQIFQKMMENPEIADSILELASQPEASPTGFSVTPEAGYVVKTIVDPCTAYPKGIKASATQTNCLIL